MVFKNIDRWIEFVKKTSVKDLIDIINEDFYLDEHIENMESDIVNPESLINIKKK